MSFLDEIAARLVAQSVGTPGSATDTARSIYLGSAASIPPGDGPYMTISETGGTSPRRSHTSKTGRPTAQILVRARSYTAARSMAKDAFTALDGVWNTTLSGTFYQKITARQEPTDIGLDGAGRVMVVFNIDAEKQPS